MVRCTCNWQRRRKNHEAMNDDDDDDLYVMDFDQSVTEDSSTPDEVSAEDQQKFDDALNIDDSTVEDPGTDMEEQDPISQADIYIAYGDLPQAEATLKEAISREPGRAELKAKLAEIYAEQGDQDKFTQALSAVQATGNANAIQVAEAFKARFPDNEPEPLSEELPDFDLSEFDSDATASSDEVIEDFEFDLDLDADDTGASVEQNQASAQDAEAAFSDEGGSHLEMSLDDDLDFVDEGDEAATKLDLARAYMDMGDMEGAASILQEVMEQGSDEQRTRSDESVAVFRG